MGKTGKVLLCAIGKLENDYILEWVEHYKNYKFDNICLYDNNDVDGERFDDILSEHISDGFVMIKDCRGMDTYQIKAYNLCYDEFKDKYEFIAFFDIDEFIKLSPKFHNDIHEFLSQNKFNKYNMIRLCWENFDDNGLINVIDNNYSVRRFTHPVSGNNQSKAIVRTTVDKLDTYSPHIITKKPKFCACNALGKKCTVEIIMQSGTTIIDANISHYRFKTIEEYITKKMVRLYPTEYCNNGRDSLNLNFFFQHNKKTKEKVEYAKKLCNELFEKKNLVVNAWFHYDKNHRITNFNWGDDINKYFISEITDYNEIIPYNKTKHKSFDNYQIIGSIVGTLTNSNSVIWGAGVPDYNTRMIEKPKCVFAVRGPLSREYLLKHNVECPEVYGDPALLLPYHYNPTVEVKYKIAFVPHWSSIDTETVKAISKLNGVKLINLHNYKNWKDIIDEILSAEYVVSESLHGLILAEAYHKKNLWINISFNKQAMKYIDFMKSIGDERTKPVKITKKTSLEEILDLCSKYVPNKGIDLKPLVESCPFILNDTFLNSFEKSQINSKPIC